MLLLAGLPVSLTRSAAPEAPFVERFTPVGVAKNVRQVTARFSTPMVALGDPRLAEPFDIQCSAPGAGRWADPRNWVYDFDADLGAGERCTFTLKADLKTLAGVAPTARERAQTYSFTTGGPAIVGSHPYEGWQEVDEQQVFLLKLDAAANPASIREHARCIVEGIGEQIPVQVLEGEERAALLRDRASLGYWYYRLLWKTGAESRVRVRDQSIDKAEEKIVLARCQRPLPPGTNVQFVWGAGIATANGIANTADQTLAFRVRNPFTAQAECTRSNAKAGCLPMLPLTVQFNAPVPREKAAAVRLKLANGKQAAPRLDPGQATIESIAFDPPFVENKPVQVILPADFVDDAGRTLGNAKKFPLEVRIDAFPPLAKFSGSFGILEAKEGGVLPVTVRNIEPKVLANQVETPAKLLRLEGDAAKVAEWIRRVETAGEGRGEYVEETAAQRAEREASGEANEKLGTDEDDEYEDGSRTRWREDTGNASLFTAQDRTGELKIPRPGNGKQSEVIGIPLKKPGFYVVEIESRILGRSLLGRDESRFVATSALVTNLAVHFKWGRESSLAWVTQLSDGKPIENAEVRILDWCNGQSQWTGRTGKDGIANVPKSLGEPHDGNGCGYRSPLMVTATVGEDFAFTQTGWSQGIGPEEFRLRRNWSGENDIQHTVLDRALFRAGETVSMKHFVREHTAKGVATPAKAAGARTVLIRHGGSGQEYSSSATFGADGIAESQWKIPAEARLGDYQVVLKSGDRQFTTAQFKVEQFRLPSMRATVGGSALPLVRPKSVDLDLHVTYLSGGGASGLPVRVRTVVQPSPVQFADYGDYTFGGKPVTEGVVNETGNEIDFEADNDGDADAATARVTPVTLDGAGGARVTIGELPEITQPSRLVAELEYADANGELMTASRNVALVPSTLNLGVRRESWAGSTTQLRFRVVALDLAGKPAANRDVKVALYGATRYSFRKRLVGGFYAYETTRETKRLAPSCQGRTDAQGLITCDVAPGFAGEVLIRAEAADAEGRIAVATTSAWIYDGDEAWFGGTSGDRMDVLPEQKAYEAGDTARFQVRLPFRKATALVTVEREGVISGFVQTLDSKSPLVDVPITAQHAPNVFVSVLAVRGRVARAETPPGAKKVARRDEITGLVDLNKPAFRLGIAAVKVGWKPHRLDVSVSADKPVYRVRERAAVKVHVARADGSALPAGTEVAFAAVDSALLGLYPNVSWELLAAMMGERSIDVLTSTAQLQVVGKRHYGRKAVPSGGSGGRDAARELFDSLLFWQARVRVDAQGDATVNVPLNDSLSEFRLVAIANGAASYFGTGSTTITTTQDLILQSGLPPVVREGDDFLATVSVRNTTNSSLEVDLSGTRNAVGKAAQALVSQRVSLAAGQSRDVSWRITVPSGVSAMSYEVRAQANGATDRLRVSQQVLAPYPVRTWQATLQQLEGSATLPLEKPAEAVPGRGHVEVTLRAKLGDGLDGVAEYFRFYPYNCIEQLVSRAIVLGEGWDAVMARLPAYLDRDGLARYFPTEAIPGEDSLTAYLLAIAHEANRPIPDDVRMRMLNGLRGFVEGRIVRSSALPTADLTVRKLAAIDVLARYEMATPAMVTSLSIEPRLWPTSAVIDWLNLTRRLPSLPRAAAHRAEAEQILRTRLNFQGTTMTFSTERTDGLWWLMISADVNANRLLLAVQDLPGWREDVPRVVRGALGRQQRGRWNTTVANAWGSVAMAKFSAKFETGPVAGTTHVSYGAKTVDLDWPKATKQREAALPWQDGPGTLTVTQEGTGKPWLQVRSLVAVPLTRPLSTGYRIERSVTPVEQKTAGRWSRGDVARVRLELTAQTDMSWVVVDDPVPAGATILGSGLGGQSQLLQRGEQRRGFVWAAFEERRFDGFRAYYRFVPKGTWTVEYTVRLNNPGTFVQPATRVEAMYAPEMFGEAPNARVVVER
ncbi:MAG: MG2 domain-containing protein [Steroidobacteraceae bacterium]